MLYLTIEGEELGDSAWLHNRLFNLRSCKSSDGLDRLPTGLHLKLDVGVNFADAELRSKESRRLEQRWKDAGPEVIGIAVRIGHRSPSAPLANDHVLSLKR